MSLEVGELYWIQQVFKDGSCGPWCILKYLGIADSNRQWDVVYEQKKGDASWYDQDKRVGFRSKKISIPSVLKDRS